MPPKLLFCTLLLAPAPCNAFAGQIAPTKEGRIGLHTRLAERYLREQHPDLAIPELQQVVALDPANVNAHGNLGVLLFFRGNYKDAVPQLPAAVKLRPDLWQLQALPGFGEAGLGDSSASQVDLETAFAHLREEELQRDVGKALIDDHTAEEELEKVSAIVSTLLEAHPTDASLLYMSYHLYSDLQGNAMLTLALVAPDSAEMHQVMARELARQNGNSAAIANYRAAIKLNPKLPGLHTELGDMLFHSDDTSLQLQVEAEFKAALAVTPRTSGRNDSWDCLRPNKIYMLRTPTFPMRFNLTLTTETHAPSFLHRTRP